MRYVVDRGRAAGSYVLSFRISGQWVLVSIVRGRPERRM